MPFPDPKKITRIFKDPRYAEHPALVLSTNMVAQSTAAADKLLASWWGDISNCSMLPRQRRHCGGEAGEHGELF